MPADAPESPPPGPATVLAIRVSPALRAELDAAAKAAGMTRTAWITDRLGAPSFSAALETVSVLQDFGGIKTVLALADSPKLAGWDRAGLRDLSQQLATLAKQWPR